MVEIEPASAEPTHRQLTCRHGRQKKRKHNVESKPTKAVTTKILMNQDKKHRSDCIDFNPEEGAKAKVEQSMKLKIILIMRNEYVANS